MHGIRRIGGSWLPAEGGEVALAPQDAQTLGLSLFQLALREIDARPASMPGDLIASLAWRAGRIVQRCAFLEEPRRFRADQSATGVLLLRNDRVSRKLGRLEPGTLAAALVDASLLAGARRFPDFLSVRQDAIEAIERRGAGDLRGVGLSAEPSALAAALQADSEALPRDEAGRNMLQDAAIAACGHAVGYNRYRLDPSLAAELALSVAFHAGWVDQRKSGR